MKIETDKARLEYEMNDPVRLEARQKAADRVKEVEFDSGIILNPDNATMDQTYAFNQSRDILNKIMPDGMELTNKGVGVYAGTNTRIRMPQWKADELKAQIGIAMAMESGKAAMNEGEIESLNSKLTLLEAAKKEGKELPPSDKIRMGQWESRRSKLIEKRDNPKSYSKMLADDNMSHFNALDVLYRMPTENAKLINMLHEKIKLNNTMLSSMSKDTTGLKSYTYTLKLKGGATKQRTEYFSPGQKIPERIRDSQGSWSRGSYKAPKGKTGSELVESQRQDTINKQSSKIRQQIFALENEEGRSQFILDRLAEGEGTEQSWKDYFRTANPQVIKELKAQLHERDRKYSGKKWYVGQNDPLGWRK
jgi:hypothetical protein